MIAATMSEDALIAPARESDLAAIRDLLASNSLPVQGVDDHWKTFIVARDDDRLVGCGGAEMYHTAALIRSIAVAEDHRGLGLGRRLVRQLIDRLASRGIREFYLLTTTAEPYFARRGFRTIDRHEVPPAVTASSEFQGACPESAICMRMVMLS